MKAKDNISWFETLRMDPVEDLKIDVAIQIEKVLDETNTSRTQLSQKINRSRSWVTKVLSGETNLTLETMCTIGTALNKKVVIDFADNDTHSDNKLKYVTTFKNKNVSQSRSVARAPMQSRPNISHDSSSLDNLDWMYSV